MSRINDRYTIGQNCSAWRPTASAFVGAAASWTAVPNTRLLLVWSVPRYAVSCFRCNSSRLPGVVRGCYRAVGKAQGADLLWRQVVADDDRDVCYAEVLRCHQPNMP